MSPLSIIFLAIVSWIIVGVTIQQYIARVRFRTKGFLTRTNILHYCLGAIIFGPFPILFIIIELIDWDKKVVIDPDRSYYH